MGIFTKGKLLGHPVHVALVHIPVGLLPVAFLFDVLGYIQNQPGFASAALHMMPVALAAAAIAIVFGTLDFFRLPNDNRILRKALFHIIFSAGSILIYLVLLMIRMADAHPEAIARPLELLMEAISLVLLIFGGYFGADMVYKHGIGVENKS